MTATEDEAAQGATANGGADGAAGYHPSPRAKRGAGRWLPGIGRRLVDLLWSTCRLQVSGAGHLDALVATGRPFIACYWHAEQIFCVRALLERRRASPGLKLGYLISPSRDGDAAARVFADLELHVIRGSATRGGARALREIYLAVHRQGISPIVTPDGPTGPAGTFKPGVALLASLAGAPVLPLGCAASRAARLRSWDRTLVPLPFSRVAVTVGAPVEMPRPLAGTALEAACLEAARAIDACGEASAMALRSPRPRERPAA